MRWKGQDMKTYKQIIHDLENCSIGGPCQDCKQTVSWKCDWKLMHRAANAIRELLHLHELDQSEIVRLRRQVEARQEADNG